MRVDHYDASQFLCRYLKQRGSGRGLVVRVLDSRTLEFNTNTGQGSLLKLRQFHLPQSGVEIALIRLSGLSKKLSGQVDRPAEVIRRTSR